MREFLWKGQNQSCGRFKVAWKDITLPLKVGGLGIKKPSEWNAAAMAKHLWKLIQPSPTSTWANWAKVNLLRGRSIWDIPIPNDCSSTWRKILSLRDKFRSCYRYLVGNGLSTFLWYDYWLPIGPLHRFLGELLVEATGLSRYAKVSSIIWNGQ